MITTTKRGSSRNKKGATLTEFAAALSLFFCCVLVPLIDITFVPVRYLLAFNNIDSVVHSMALSEKRSQALQYLHGDKSWKKAVECWGVTVKELNASIVICDQTGNTKVTLPEGTRIPNSLLPIGTTIAKGDCVYTFELTTTIDVPPLFSGGGLPGFNRPIEFKLRNRAPWENLSPDPYTTTDPKSAQYYINE